MAKAGVKATQAKSTQAKSTQAKSTQAKSTQAKSTQAKSSKTKAKATKPPSPAAAAFAALAAALDDPRVERAGRSERMSLRVRGKVFAMSVKGRLVVKLPAARCQALVDTGRGDFLVMGRRIMKEWVTFAPDAPGAAKRWLALAREALAHVTSASR
jgi:hypothetical protein